MNKISGIYIDQLGIIGVGSTNMYGALVYDEITYDQDTQMYRCYSNGKLEAEFNKQFVIKVEYE
jgi:hypothetical protein